MISVVVNSLNEGEKLKRCLGSVVDLADEIVVIDMESSDDTAEVSRKFHAKIISHPPLKYVEPVRRFAVSKTSEPWVLVLDPDETVPQRLKDELIKVAKENLADIVLIPRLNIIFGKKVKRTNFWPDRHPRFFKKDKVSFSDIIHSQPKLSGKVISLPSREDLALRHYPYQNISEYWQRMKRYSDVEAQNLYDKGVRFSIFNLFYKPMYDFVRRYIKHLGFLDGLIGLELSLLQAYYYFLVEIKFWQKGRK